MTVLAYRPQKHALIAPFKLHNLPKPEIVKMIEETGFEVKISGGADSREIKESISKECEPITKVIVTEAIPAGEDIIKACFNG